MSEQETDNTDEKEAETGNLYDKCLDPNCIMNIEKRLVRIEYPGEVKNVDKAIETLGGLDNIENVSLSHFKYYILIQNSYLECGWIIQKVGATISPQQQVQQILYCG